MRKFRKSSATCGFAAKFAPLASYHLLKIIDLAAYRILKDSFKTRYAKAGVNGDIWFLTLWVSRQILVRGMLWAVIHTGPLTRYIPHVFTVDDGSLNELKWSPS